MQHAVCMRRASDLDVVGQLELALERAGGDATVQVSAVAFLFGLASRDDQGAFAQLDG